VLDLETDAVAASWTVVDDRLARWQAGFDGLFALVAGRFAQVESRRRARLYLLGLLSGAERKNSWTIAEQAGELSPDGMQRLLNFYRWDADAVRDDLRSYVLTHLGDPAGVVVADETGFLKKGHLCRVRHYVPYADRRIMRSQTVNVLFNGGYGCYMVGIIPW
jgi:SRSO17 transposase